MTNNIFKRIYCVVSPQLNFWLTNRIPRTLLTHWMGRLSRIRHRTFAKVAIRLWQKFSDLDLTEAKTDRFDSIHDCFVRRLKEGARPFDLDARVVCSPCDALVGQRGQVEQNTIFQAKGMPYSLSDLMGCTRDAASCEGYSYVTLRLTSTMYHHFHAPHDVAVECLRYIHGDVWNVNPPTLARIRALFALNERAVIKMTLERSDQIAWLVPVAAVLVASMRFTFSDVHLHLNYQGPTQVQLASRLSKGQEMGWFEHGSTIICLMPPGWAWHGPASGERIKAGQRLWTQDI